MSNQLQDTVQNFLNTAVAEGRERGVQVAAYIDGKLVIDAWAGITDVRTGSPVDGDSLFPVFSTVKGVFSTVMHILAERGQLDYDKPIANYWPEFAANGKEAITVRHALAHTSGIPYMPPEITVEQSTDWDYMCRQIAQLTPISAPGARQQYHAVTFGWIVGETARRITGHTVPQLLEEEICRPLGITRLFCGIPAELEPQTAFLELVPNPLVAPSSPPREVSPSMMPLHEWLNRAEVRRAPQPGCSGIMSARAVARHYAALLPGGVDGVELLPVSRLKIATTEQVPSEGHDKNVTTRKGIGYQIGSAIADVRKNPEAFGHYGYGGSMGFADPDYGIAIGITRNRFADQPLSGVVMKAIYKSLGAS